MYNTVSCSWLEFFCHSSPHGVVHPPVGLTCLVFMGLACTYSLWQDFLWSFLVAVVGLWLASSIRFICSSSLIVSVNFLEIWLDLGISLPFFIFSWHACFYGYDGYMWLLVWLGESISFWACSISFYVSAGWCDSGVVRCWRSSRFFCWEMCWMLPLAIAVCWSQCGWLVVAHAWISSCLYSKNEVWCWCCFCAWCSHS